MTEDIKGKRTLIITVVPKGWGDSVIEASMKAGAKGGTIVFGRGLGIHEKKKILGIQVEPEKEIVFTLVNTEKVDAILNEIVKVSRLDEPGRGIAFTLPVERCLGIIHTLEDNATKELQDYLNA